MLEPAMARTPRQAQLAAIGAKGWKDSALYIGLAAGAALGLITGLALGSDARRKRPAS